MKGQNPGIREIIDAHILGSLSGASLNSEAFELPSLWSRINGDADLLREMVAIFKAEYPPLLSELERAIEHSDAARAERAAHRLKGSLVQFSAHRAAATAASLEIMGKKNSLEGAREAVRCLGREIEDLLQALSRVISRATTG